MISKSTPGSAVRSLALTVPTGVLILTLVCLSTPLSVAAHSSDVEPSHTLTINKVLINDNGGKNFVTDFDFTVTTADGSASYTFNSNSTTVIPLPLGRYQVTEGNYEGYLASYSDGCSGFGGDSNVSCTITNNDIPPKLTLIKTVSGGNAQAVDFTLQAKTGQDIALSGVSGVTSGDSFQAGTYGLSETGGPAGYTASAWNCDLNGTNGLTGLLGADLTLETGDDILCTLTNTFGTDEGGSNGTTTDEGSTTPPTDGGGDSPDITHHSHHVQTESGSNNGDVGGGSVLGASTSTPEALPEGCTPLLTDYLKLGWHNSPEEVRKLQNFLNTELGLHLDVSGIFNPETYGAVKEFQLKYWNDVLHPWVAHGLANDHTSTGFVFKTTKWKINLLACSTLNTPAPELP